MTPSEPGRSLRQESLRRHNLALALRQVVDAEAPVSRADIAAATGLTRATASALVDQLIAAGLVTERAPVAGGRAGRPAVPLVPARGTVAALGCEVNVDYLGVHAVDLAGEVLVEVVDPGDLRSSRPEEVLVRLAASVRAVVDRLAAQDVLVTGAALALPGLVDSRTGPLRVAPNLGWRDLDVVALLAGAMGEAGLDPRLVPRLGNEADLAARAEAHARRHVGPSSFVYVSGEIGVGAAIVLDGRIFAGRHGWSGEIGHVVVPAPSRPGGSGTLEELAGQEALLLGAGLDAGGQVSALVDLGTRAGVEGDRARAALGEAGRALGVALANVVNMVDVEHVVLGGVYAALAPHLLGPVAAELRGRVISSPWAEVDVSVAAAGSYPAMTGGALWVLADLVADPSGGWGAAIG